MDLKTSGEPVDCIPVESAPCPLLCLQNSTRENHLYQGNSENSLASLGGLASNAYVHGKFVDLDR